MTLAPMPVQSAAVTVEPAFLDRITALRQTLAPTLTDPELELFALVAQRKGLDPFSGQILAVKRNSKQGPRVTYQTGIDGYRSLAERTNQYLGSDEPEFGPACGCGKPASYHPEWARVVVHRLHPSGRVVDQAARAKWHEFVPSDAFMWFEKPEVMLGKCAEAQALRKAFPWVLGDLYIPEEMARGDEPQVAPAVVSAREAVAARAAALRGAETPAQDAQEAPQGDDEPPAAPVVQAPEPPGPGPSTAAEPADDEPPPATLTRDQFQARLTAAGLTIEDAKAAAQDVFPGRPSASLTPAEWAELWDHLAATT